MNFGALAKKFKQKKRYTSDNFDIINITTGEIQNKETVKDQIEKGIISIHLQIVMYEDLDIRDLGVFSKLRKYNINSR